MVLSSLIRQLLVESKRAGADRATLEPSEQCGRGPKGFRLFLGFNGLISVYLRGN